MTTLGILAVLGVVGALGAAWDLMHKSQPRPLVASDAERTRAEGTLTYYAQVWDSAT